MRHIIRLLENNLDEINLPLLERHKSSNNKDFLRRSGGYVNLLAQDGKAILTILNFILRVEDLVGEATRLFFTLSKRQN